MAQSKNKSQTKLHESKFPQAEYHEKITEKSTAYLSLIIMHLVKGVFILGIRQSLIKLSFFFKILVVIVTLFRCPYGDDYHANSVHLS